MRRAVTLLAAVLSSLALATGLLAATSLGAEARKRPAPVTAKALRNAPIKGVCGGWKGRFTKGALRDSRNYESIHVDRVALGDLDGKRGRDGAIVVRCGTRMPYADYVVAYTADKRGRPVQRQARYLPSVDPTLDRYDGFVRGLTISSRRVVARWESSEVDSNGENADSGVVPTVGRLGLRKGKLVRTAIQRQGMRWHTKRFAAAMRHKKYAAAARLAPKRVVARLKHIRAQEWSHRIHWYYGAWQPGVERYTGTVYFENSGATLVFKFNERTRRWVITDGYDFG